MTTGQQLVDVARNFEGLRYVFGAEVPASLTTLDQVLAHARAHGLDCSEAIEAYCRILGMKVPDGAYYQWKAFEPIQLGRALQTPGAVLFYGSGRGVGRAAISHVALSDGKGNTSGEARNTVRGVGSWPIGSRFTFAALIQGVDYSRSTTTVPANPLEHIAQGVIREDNDMGAFLRADPAKGGDGSIYHVYGERIRHLTPAQWAKREFLGAKVENHAPIEILNLAADLISDPTG